MMRTKMAVQVDTDCHEIIPNRPLSQLLARNFRKVGPPQFSREDVALARQLQSPLRAEFGQKETKALEDQIEEVPEKPSPADGGSTDVGDVSWHVPTGSPGHSWQNVAAIG